MNAKKTDILLYFNKESRVNESADANSRKGLAINYSFPSIIAIIPAMYLKRKINKEREAKVMNREPGDAQHTIRTKAQECDTCNGCTNVNVDATNSADDINIKENYIHDHDHTHRPILVGYAFGPKKMSTMSVVMAEASLAVSTVVTHFPKHLRNQSQNGCASSHHHNHHHTTNQINNAYSTSSANTANGHKKQRRSLGASSSSISSFADEQIFELNGDGNEDGERQEHIHEKCHDADAETVIEREHEVDDEANILMDGDIDDQLQLPMPMPTPICIFPSSFFLSSNCEPSNKKFNSSLEEASLVTATTASTSTQSLSLSQSTHGLSQSSSSSSSSVSNIHHHDLQHLKKWQHLQPMRVSFVPLDLDAPLDEQHGGKFDAILHKMTEDILCKSQLDRNRLLCSTTQQLATTSTSTDNIASNNSSNNSISSRNSVHTESERQALKRIERLKHYQRKHPACCLVDHPNNVQKLMSRSDIASTLKQCLRNVTTKSGIAVRTPRYKIISLDSQVQAPPSTSNSNIQSMRQMKIDEAQLEYPLIVKPLIAAGTKQSHKMGVLLGRHGLKHVPGNGPHLLQEYANHDGVLFKVYVLGKKVWVFQRTSLPNLPLGEASGSPEDCDNDCGGDNENGHEIGPRNENATSQNGFVEFDSQRPYPTLDDFGISTSADIVSEEQGGKAANHDVTVAEIRPVADSIRKAFRLELFGFDILVTRKGADSNDKEILVVDVNYFPSYKEVTNFSQLLAQYLAQCGIEGRLRSFESSR